MPQESNGTKRRRRRRRRRMNPLLYMLLVVAVSALLAGLGWMWAGDVLALNKVPHSAVITVNKDDTLADVTNALQENGLINYKPLFQLFCTVTGVEEKEKIKPGTYELNTDMDYNALIIAMSSSSGSRMVTTVMIPEGYTIDQIFALLEEKGVSTVELLESVAANHDFKFSFLQGVLPLGDYHRLEGYLFPDTYEFYMGGGESAAVQVLNKMILRFDQLFTDELRAQAEDQGYSIHDIVTIASLIEKETDGEDQRKISAVIHNRLERPNDETVGLLGIEAALVYAAGRPITEDDFDMDSPYNTFAIPGLPPTPIASPGMVALYSALNPDPDSARDYFYFLGNDRKHHYFRTYDAWQSFIAQQRAERESR